jgi:GNAT superfamily N-acetyltransferase
MQVREYKGEDSVEARELILSILKKEYPFDRSAYRDTDINDISGAYSGKGNAFFVVEESGKIIGAIGVKKETGDVALIRRLSIDENHRKKGYGSALLKKAVDFCKSEKYKEIVFRTTDKMAAAMKLCQKNGFTEKEKLDLGGFAIHTFILKI